MLTAGPDLDALTHRAIGRTCSPVPPYSTEWAAGGRLVGMLVDSGYITCRMFSGSAVSVMNMSGPHERFEGETVLEAACRAIVGIRLGITAPKVPA